MPEDNDAKPFFQEEEILMSFGIKSYNTVIADSYTVLLTSSDWIGWNEEGQVIGLVQKALNSKVRCKTIPIDRIVRISIYSFGFFVWTRKFVVDWINENDELNHLVIYLGPESWFLLRYFENKNIEVRGRHLVSIFTFCGLYNYFHVMFFLMPTITAMVLAWLFLDNSPYYWWAFYGPGIITIIIWNVLLIINGQKIRKQAAATRKN